MNPVYYKGNTFLDLLILMAICIYLLACNNPNQSLSSVEDGSNSKIDTMSSIRQNSGTLSVDTGGPVRPELHTEEKTITREPDLYVIETERKTDVNFEPYYILEVKNHSKARLISFKFKFSYLLADDRKLPPNLKDFVIIRQDLESGDTGTFSVPEPDDLKLAKNLGIATRIDGPFLSTAIDVDGNTIPTKEGREDAIQQLINTAREAEHKNQ